MYAEHKHTTTATHSLSQWPQLQCCQHTLLHTPSVRLCIHVFTAASNSNTSAAEDTSCCAEHSSSALRDKKLQIAAKEHSLGSFQLSPAVAKALTCVRARGCGCGSRCRRGCRRRGLGLLLLCVLRLLHRGVGRCGACGPPATLLLELLLWRVLLHRWLLRRGRLLVVVGGGPRLLHVRRAMRLGPTARLRLGHRHIPRGHPRSRCGIRGGTCPPNLRVQAGTRTGLLVHMTTVHAPQHTQGHRGRPHVGICMHRRTCGFKHSN